jgi:zinc/manganese transport system substrate-binding protein
MKRLLLIAATALALFQPLAARAAVNVFACEPEWAALAKEIGGDKVDVTAASSGTQDPHYVRAKPSLLGAMRKANLVFCTGAGLEAGYLPVLMQQAAPSSVQPGNPGYLMAANSIRLVGAPAKVDRAMGDVHPEGNPHIQTDPRNILAAAKPLAEHLGQIDPANAAYYQKRLSDFTAAWQPLVKKWQAGAVKLKGTPIVVYHDEWAYLNRWLGLSEIATLEVKPGVPPTPSHLQEVLSAAKSNGVKTIILAPFDDDEAARWLADQTGAKIVHLPFTVGGVNGTDTLEAVFDKTVSALAEAAK